jgi:hypothetical protein
MAMLGYEPGPMQPLMLIRFRGHGARTEQGAGLRRDGMLRTVCLFRLHNHSGSQTSDSPDLAKVELVIDSRNGGFVSLSHGLSSVSG